MITLRRSELYVKSDLIKAHPINIVTVMADLLLISVVPSFGQELVDKRFTTQIKKLVKDTIGGIPDSPVHNIPWIVYHICEEDALLAV